MDHGPRPLSPQDQHRHPRVIGQAIVSSSLCFLPSPRLFALYMWAGGRPFFSRSVTSKCGGSSVYFWRSRRFRPEPLQHEEEHGVTMSSYNTDARPLTPCTMPTYILLHSLCSTPPSARPHHHSNRGSLTLGAEDIVEAISDPKKASTCTSTIAENIKKSIGTNERVRHPFADRVLSRTVTCRCVVESTTRGEDSPCIQQAHW